MLVLLLLGAACTSGDDDSTGTGAKSASSQRSEKSDKTSEQSRDTTTTMPPDEPLGTKPIAVAPYIQELLGRYDQLVQQIVADPSVVSDRSNAVVGEFLSLFNRSSEFAAGSLDGWESKAAQGVTLKPLAPGQPVSQTKLEGPPQSIDEDTVTFGQCTILSYVTYTHGKETERVERRALAGNGKAVRVAGHWKLTDISTPPGMKGCIAEGGVSS